MLYDACNMLIIRKQTLWLMTSDMMNVAMLDCYECMNLIWKLWICVITNHVLPAYFYNKWDIFKYIYWLE